MKYKKDTKCKYENTASEEHFLAIAKQLQGVPAIMADQDNPSIYPETKKPRTPNRSRDGV